MPQISFSRIFLLWLHSGSNCTCIPLTSLGWLIEVKLWACCNSCWPFGMESVLCYGQCLVTLGASPWVELTRNNSWDEGKGKVLTGRCLMAVIFPRDFFLDAYVSLPCCRSFPPVGNSRGTLCGKTCKEDRDDEWMGVSLARQPKAGGSVLVGPLFSLISLKSSLLSDFNAKHIRINAFGSDWWSPALWAANSVVPSFKQKENELQPKSCICRRMTSKRSHLTCVT